MSTNLLKEIFCDGCQEKFVSKTALFRHLRASEGKCFSPEEYKDFVKYFVNSESNREKIMILYGYIPGDYYLSLGLKNEKLTIHSDSPKQGVCDGQHASQLILEAIETVSYEGDIDEAVKSSKINTRPNRSYGHFSHSNDICAQDELTGAVTEILTTRAPPLLVEDCSKAEHTEKEEEATKTWIDKVNDVLTLITSDLATDAKVEFPGFVKVFGRLQAPKRFNAEMDVNHRRIDYVLPADVLFGTEQIISGMQMGEFLESIEAFHPDRIAENGHNPRTDSKIQDFKYVYKMKKLMQRFCTQVVDLDTKDKAAVLAKEFHRQKRMNKGKGSKNHKSNENGNGKGQDKEKEDLLTSEETVEKILEKQKNGKGEKERVLKRKRFHNFTRTAMAHEFLSFRRVDRFFHRASLRFDDSDSTDANGDSLTRRSRPYIILSAKGDLFLSGQVRGMVGLLIAIVRGFIDVDILDCVFDEDYPNLVPCPFAPVTGLFAGEVNYSNWEGRMNAVLTPRDNDRWKKGWKSQEIISTIEDFQQEMYKSIARAWDKDGNASLDQDLPAVSDWIKNCLEPWSVRAKEQYSDYCQWKKAKEEIGNDENTEIALMEKLTPPLSSVSSDIPTLYRKVLELLQDADRGNLWPSTSPKRQLVMVSTNDNPQNKNTTLAHQHLKAKSNVFEKNSSAYSYKEGQGGASGSFSVGAMPGLGCEPPKGNSLFPELMKAAFELEIAICPDREPSSTIAINRNAQFRPHIDSGAGAGQSRSLIVGIGTFSGGELMVEGEKHTIRYKPLEFNGWTERHWTRPFLGERYSLVWFTPIGCEGVHGIDLCE